MRRKRRARGSEEEEEEEKEEEKIRTKIGGVDSPADADADWSGWRSRRNTFYREV